MTAPGERITLLHTETERIKRYLHALPPEAWDRQSACDQWQVRDVVAHLAGGAEFYASNITRGLQGDTEPAAGRPPAGSGKAAMVSDAVARRAIAARESLGDQLLITFDTANDHLNHLLASLTPDNCDTPCYHPGGIVPARNFADLRLKELSMHDWDIRSGIEPEAHLSPAVLPVILGALATSLASGSMRWAFWPGERLSQPVRYRFVLTDADVPQPDLVVEGDHLRLEPAGDTPADVTLQGDAETYVLLMYGRVKLAAALASGRLHVTGDQAQARALSQWFKGI
jgi:uncharacterized protein (TIGR03083 family)